MTTFVRMTLTSAFLVSVLSSPASAQVHDLSVSGLKIGPKRAKLTDTRPVRTGRIIVKINNEGSETLNVADMATLDSAVTLNITQLPGPRACGLPTVTPDFSKKATPPFSVAPSKKLKLRYAVDFGCGSNPEVSIDWSFSMTLDHAALDGNADEDTSDDVCPRQPAGDDKGCGKKISGGARIEPTVDVDDRRSSLSLVKSGPYTVAQTNMVFVDASRPTMANGTYPGAPDRTLDTLIWYPATSPAQDSPLDLTGGPYPFIVFAHGLGSPNNASQVLTTHLASHGYIVIAPAFPLSTFLAPGGPSTADQPAQALDVAFLIDTFLAFNTQPAHMFEGSIDPDKIGMTGHSNGAMSTVITTYDATLRDTRIKAAMPMSPPGCIFQPGWYGAVDIPLMVLHGDNDLLVDFDGNAQKIYDRANASKSLVRFVRGNHMNFSDAAISIGLDDVGGCAFLPDAMTLETQFTALIAALGGAPAFVSDAGCSTSFCDGPLDPDAMDPFRQLDLMLYAGTAFFESTLRNNPVATAYLANELDATNPDIVRTSE